MSRVKIIEVAGNEYPLLFSQRTFINYEATTKSPISKIQEGESSKKAVTLVLEALRSGHKATKKTFTMTYDGLLDLDDQTDFINIALEEFGKEEKKPEPISQEN